MPMKLPIKLTLGHGFVFTSNSISVSGNTEVDFILLTNPNGSGKTVKVFHLFMSMLAGTTSDYGIFRSYRNPTITSNGTATAVNNITSTGSSSIVNAYLAPTISNRGTLLSSYPVIDSQISIDMEFLLFIPPNESKLITAQPSQTNKLHTVTMRWLEV